MKAKIIIFLLLAALVSAVVMLFYLVMTPIEARAAGDWAADSVVHCHSRSILFLIITFSCARLAGIVEELK